MTGKPINQEPKFDFNDVLIQPTTLSNISTRSQVNPFDNLGYLPLFTAPMTSVVNDSNDFFFLNNNIRVTMPRTIIRDEYTLFFNSHESRFISFGLTDFKSIFVDNDYKLKANKYTTHVLLDVANGHMIKVLDLIGKAKANFPSLVIMAGNIASPDTFNEYAKSGIIDYARIGIGNGNGCLTTEQTGVGYPMGSLVHECKLIKDHFDYKIKIVADGGMKKYADIIKALALGADFVMIGSIFNKALESASPLYWKGIKLNRSLGNWMYKHNYKIEKEFYGMSTKKAQVLLGNNELKTSEGVTRNYPVEYTIKQWVENFESYYRSALSYSGSYNIDDFHKNARINLITQNAYMRYNK